MLDGRDRTRDFARDKGFAPPRTLVIKKNAVAGVEPVAFAIVHRRPVGKNLGNAVGAARPERRALGLRNLLRLAIHLAAGSLVKARANTGLPNRFQNANRSDASHIGGIFRNIETHAHMALRAEMVNLIRLQIIKQFHQINGISQIAVMEKKSDAVNVRVDIKMIDAGGVEGAGAPDYSVNLVAFFQ